MNKLKYDLEELCDEEIDEMHHSLSNLIETHGVRKALIAMWVVLEQYREAGIISFKIDENNS